MLWVEDHRAEIVGFHSRLLNMGLDVSHRPSRERAEQFLREHRCDYIVLDLWMKDDKFDDQYSGAHLLKKLRQGDFGEWGREVPVVLYTAHGKLAPAGEWIWQIEPGLDALVNKGDGKMEDIAEGLLRPRPSLRVAEAAGGVRLSLEMRDAKAAPFAPLLTRECAHALLTSSTHEVPASISLGLNQTVEIDAKRREGLTATDVEVEVYRRGARTDYFWVHDGEDG
jgi:hypothetical protein